MVLFCRAILTLIFVTAINGKKVRKRQLFREQLIPSLGGKVPESAFWTERLALNLLNAKGIYSSSGVYLEHRRPKYHPQPSESHPKTMQVSAPVQGYIAPPGRHYHNPSTSVDTTYLIRDPVSTTIKWNPLPQLHPLIPYTSLKLARYYNQKRRQQDKNKDSPWNEVENTNQLVLKVKKEFEPYLKKLHEQD